MAFTTATVNLIERGIKQDAVDLTAGTWKFVIGRTVW